MVMGQVSNKLHGKRLGQVEELELEFQAHGRWAGGGGKGEVGDLGADSLRTPACWACGLPPRRPSFSPPPNCVFDPVAHACVCRVKDEAGKTHMQLDGEPWPQGVPPASSAPLKVCGLVWCWHAQSERMVWRGVLPRIPCCVCHGWLRGSLFRSLAFTYPLLPPHSRQVLISRAGQSSMLLNSFDMQGPVKVRKLAKRGGTIAPPPSVPESNQDGQENDARQIP